MEKREEILFEDSTVKIVAIYKADTNDLLGIEHRYPQMDKKEGEKETYANK